MRRVAVRGLLARRARLGLTALAVALGVTLIAGTYVFTDTINASFDAIFTQAYRGTDAVVMPRQPLGGGDEEDAQAPALPARLLGVVRRTPGIAQAEGTIFSHGMTLLGRDGKPIGFTGGPKFIASAHAVARFSAFGIERGRLPRRDDEMALLEATVSDQRFRLGDEVGVQARTPRRDYRLVGVIRFAGVQSLGGAQVGVFTLPEAQRLAGERGRFDAIDASAAPGVSPAELKRRLAAVLPRSVRVRTGAEQAASQSKDIRDNLSFLRTALLAFAGIALFVGAFIIFNTFTITVVQRTREFALLRTLGASRRQVMASVLVEGLVIGALGAAAGLGLGIALAAGLRALFDAVGFSLPSSGTVIASRTVVVSLVVGTLITVLSSLVPAVRATRVPPVAALREGAVLPAGRGARLVTPLAALLTLAAVVLLCWGLFGGLASGPALSLVGFGGALAFVGVALLSPRFVGPLAAAVGAPLERAAGLTGRLARENAVRQPGRTAATAAALMVGVTMFAFASIFAASARSTIRNAVNAGSRAQFIVQNRNGFGPITPRVAGAVARVPGVARVSRVRFTEGRTLDGRRRSVVGIDPASFGALFHAGAGSAALARLGPGTTVISKKYADDAHLRPGDVVAVRTARGLTARLRVIGVVDDRSHLTGQLTVTNAVLAAQFGANEDGLVLVGAAPAAQRAVSAMLARDYPQAKALTNQQFIDQQAGKVDRLLTLIYALLALTVIVALFGIVNTLVLSITERTRELGMLRAIGTSRAQIRGMIRYEAMIMGLIGGVLGIALGTLLALLVSRVVPDLTLSIPVGSVVALVLLAGAAGMLASVLPARRAARLDVLAALAYE